MPTSRSAVHQNAKTPSPLPEKIIAFLEENPGAQLYKIVAAVGASRGAVTYQMRILLEKGLVKVHRETGYNRYYLHTFAYERDEAVLANFRENPIKADIIRILRETPGLSRLELAERTGIPENTIYRHIAALGDAGILKRERSGHSWLYRMAEISGHDLQ